MAATVTINEDIPIGATKHFYELTILMDSSYVTGGEPIDVAANTRFTRMSTAVNGGYVGEFIPTTQLLKVYYADNNNASDGPLIEVPNATDLSAVTFLVTATGA